MSERPSSICLEVLSVVPDDLTFDVNLSVASLSRFLLAILLDSYSKSSSTFNFTFLDNFLYECAKKRGINIVFINSFLSDHYQRSSLKDPLVGTKLVNSNYLWNKTVSDHPLFYNDVTITPGNILLTDD